MKDQIKEILLDRRLSYRARAVLLRLLLVDSCATADSLADGSPGGGRQAMLAALGELRNLGYISTRKAQDAHGRWTTKTTLTIGLAEVGLPDSGKPTRIAPTEVGLPDSGQADFNKINKYIKQQQHNARVRAREGGAAAAPPAKRRRVRESGIVAWVADDDVAAARLEASFGRDLLAAAIEAVRARGRDPVPGAVEREAEIILARAAAARRAAGLREAQDARARMALDPIAINRGLAMLPAAMRARAMAAGATTCH